jgi:nucleotide-binding universal stress UspA family protein
MPLPGASADYDHQSMSAGRAEPGRVLVAIDGSKASRYALRWAAQEARLRHTSLIITHVDPSATNVVGAGPSASGADALLELSAATASQMEPSVTVATVLLRGSISAGLVNLSTSAAMLVLAVDVGRSRASHGGLGPTEDRILAQARCPVVTVNGAPRTFEHSQPFIVVGWTDNKTGHRALAAAATEAELRNATLTIVSVIPRLDSEHGFQGPRDHDRALENAKALLRGSHAGLAVDVVQAGGEVSEALVRHSRHADVLVIGCHHTSDRWSLRTGPVAKAVMRQAECPVMLVARLRTGQLSSREILPKRSGVDELIR